MTQINNRFLLQNISIRTQNNTKNLDDSEAKDNLSQAVNSLFSTEGAFSNVLKALHVSTCNGVKFFVSQTGDLYGAKDTKEWVNLTNTVNPDKTSKIYDNIARVSKDILHKYIEPENNQTPTPSNPAQVLANKKQTNSKKPALEENIANTQAVQVSPKGINNEGNNCWINSIMQMLHLSDSLKQKILQKGLGLENDHPLMKYESLNGPSLRNAFNELVFEGNIPSDFQQGQQADVLVALSSLLGKIKDENPLNFQTTVDNMITTYDSNPYNNKAAKVTNFYAEPTEETESLLNLSLSLSSNSNLNLKDLLTSYLREELNPHEEEFGFRNNVNMRRTAIERKFKTNPDQLLISLKRFETTTEGAAKKITKDIDVPLSLNLSNLSAEEKPFDLELKSFIVHRGTSTNNGHYINYTKVGDQWYQNNDSRVTEITEDKAKDLAKQAYLVYFEKKQALEQAE